MKRECPYCGGKWFIRNDRKMDLLRNGVLPMKCYVCGKEFELQKKDRTIYIRYGENRERIGSIGELA